MIEISLKRPWMMTANLSGQDERQQTKVAKMSTAKIVAIMTKDNNNGHHSDSKQ
jgi:hypothetical protein